jgi:hypothetical protein
MKWAMADRETYAGGNMIEIDRARELCVDCVPADALPGR